MEFLDPEQTYENQTILKLIIVGKSEIGKSFFCNRINLNYTKFQHLDLEYRETIGFEIYKKAFKLKNKFF